MVPRLVGDHLLDSFVTAYMTASNSLPRFVGDHLLDSENPRYSVSLGGEGAVDEGDGGARQNPGKWVNNLFLWLKYLMTHLSGIKLDSREEKIKTGLTSRKCRSRCLVSG